MTLTLTTFTWALPLLGSPLELYRISDFEPGYQKESARISGAVDEVEVALDTEALDKNPEILEFELPERPRLRVVRSRFDVENGYLTWVGEARAPDGRPSGYVHLVDHGDRVSGILNLGSDRYQIVATELMGHRLVRVGAGSAGSCPFQGSESYLEFGDQHPVALQSGEVLDRVEVHEGNSHQPYEITDSAGMADKITTTIDVLAIYPNAFSNAADEASLHDFIQLSVSLANDAFINSNVNARYRLVAMTKLTAAQPPGTSLSDSWVWINQEPAEIRSLRDDHSADMVALFIPQSWDDDPIPACGIANLPEADGGIRSDTCFGSIPGPFGQRAFTVHRDGCGLNDFTFAHELGHNFGMRHGGEGVGANHLFPNGRGHQLNTYPWQVNANGNLETNVSGNFAVGYHFTPLANGFITEIGGFFAGVKFVRLFHKETGRLLGEIQVSAANTWRYRIPFRPDEGSAGAIPVEADETYTVAVYIGGTGGGSIYHNVDLLPRVYGDIRIEGATAVSTLNDPDARPTSTRLDLMWGLADVRFVRAATVMDCIGYEPTVMGCVVTEPDGDITSSVCNRVPHFSDPGIQYSGYDTGTIDSNNAAVARAQVGPYSVFRDNNAPPVCQDDYLTTLEGTRLSIALGHLLGNDSDPDGDPLRLQSYDRRTAEGGFNDRGHVGGFNYTPPRGFTGRDHFFYTTSDRASGGLTDTCVVYVDVVSDPSGYGIVKDAWQ